MRLIQADKLSALRIQIKINSSLFPCFLGSTTDDFLNEEEYLKEHFALS